MPEPEIIEGDVVKVYRDGNLILDILEGNTLHTIRTTEPVATDLGLLPYRRALLGEHVRLTRTEHGGSYDHSSVRKVYVDHKLELLSGGQEGEEYKWSLEPADTQKPYIPGPPLPPLG